MEEKSKKKKDMRGKERREIGRPEIGKIGRDRNWGNRALA